MTRLRQLLERSDALHRVVQAAAHAGHLAAFEDVATRLAALQSDASPGYARLIDERRRAGAAPGRIASVPSRSFRIARVAVHPPELDVARFTTSGTTRRLPGVHAFRRLDTYRAIAIRHARDSLLGEFERAQVLALAPPPTIPASSSLLCMMQFFMESFTPEDVGAPTPTTRWLLTAAGLDLAGLDGAVQSATDRQHPVLLLGTSSALVLLLDQLKSSRLALPEGSRVMLTGGFKGRSATFTHHQLKARLSDALKLPRTSVIGEYGMTELTGQLYENVHAPVGEGHGTYLEPPWLRVNIVDALTLEPVAQGETGVAEFVDLGNVDSAVAVLTEDLVRRTEYGIELMGRRQSAPVRGCSLATEALLGSTL